MFEFLGIALVVGCLYFLSKSIVLLLRNKSIKGKKTICSILFLILFSVALFAFLFFAKNSYFTLNYKHYFYVLFSPNNIASLVVMCFTMIAFMLAYNEFRHTKERRSHEEALKLIHVYQQKLLPKMFIVFNVYRDTNLLEKYIDPLKNNQSSKTLGFDNSEAKKIFHDNIYSELEHDLSNIDPKIVLQYFSEYDAPTIGKTSSFRRDYAGNLELLSSSDSSDETVRKSITTETRRDFVNLIFELQNELEWFCMNFCTKVADENVAYQSLHQTFLSCVMHLYLTLTKNNNDFANKYYSHISEMYNLWNERQKNVVKIQTKLTKKYEALNKQLEMELVHKSKITNK